MLMDGGIRIRNTLYISSSLMWYNLVYVRYVQEAALKFNVNLYTRFISILAHTITESTWRVKWFMICYQRRIWLTYFCSHFLDIYISVNEYFSLSTAHIITGAITLTKPDAFICRMNATFDIASWIFVSYRIVTPFTSQSSF